jgi:hypothetical protein
MVKISMKREYTTNCEVDAIPQIAHCLQMVEINPQFGLYCVENIFYVWAEIVHGENEQPAWMILIQIVKNMINETIESFNCCASLHPLSMPTHSANIFTANCKK